MLIILWEDGRGIYITVFTARMQKHVSACKITCMRLFSISDSILADKVSGFTASNSTRTYAFKSAQASICMDLCGLLFSC